MAKKRQSKSSKSEGLFAMQLRLDPNVHCKLKQEAERAGISLNQLVSGICQACSQTINQGDAKKHEGGFVSHTNKPKCVYFGQAGQSYTKHEQEDFLAEHGIELGDGHNGKLWFVLDFSGDPVRLE